MVFKNKIILKSQLGFKSDYQIVYTDKYNKIAITSNDDKRIQTFDGSATYPYRTNAFEVYEEEMLVRTNDTLIKLYY